MRIALIAHVAAASVLPAAAIKPRYRAGEHPAPWVRLLATALAQTPGTTVAIFSDSRAVAVPQQIEVDAVRHHFIPKTEPIRTDPWHLHLPATLRLRPHIRAFKPDIVVGFGTEHGHGRVACRMHVPSVVFIQGIFAQLAPLLPMPALRRRLQLHIERSVINTAGGLVAETAFARDWARSINPSARIRVIPHALDTTLLDLEPTYAEPRVLAAGSLVAHKGFDNLLRAFARTAPPARLLIAGEGPERANLEQLAAGLGIAERVEWTGQLAREKLRAELLRARLLAVPSRMDTSPNILTEAHAGALPVVGARAGGIPDMIEDGRDGYLADAVDPEAFAGKLRALLDNPALARRLGETGRENVRTLNDPARIAAQHLDFYREVIAA